MVKTERFIQLEVRSISELREWLQGHQSQKESIWLILYKKSFGQYYIPKIDIIDELLCFGWLDGMARKVDEDKYLLLASPRRIDHWAESYKKRISVLQAENRMAPAGLAAVERSKRNGGWNLMDDVDALAKPLDFIACLEEYPPAMTNFDRFVESSKRFMLRYIKLAKTDVTRQKRILELAKLAQVNKKLPGS